MIKLLFTAALFFSTSMTIYAQERIIMNLGKWQPVAQSDIDGLKTKQYEPRSQFSDIHESIVVHTFSDKQVTNVQAHLLELREARKQNCQNFSVIEIPVQGASPSPAAGQVLYCGLEPETGEGVITMQRVTQGQENLYLIEKIWRTFPFDHPESAYVVLEEINPWIPKMARTYVCGSDNLPECPTNTNL